MPTKSDWALEAAKQISENCGRDCGNSLEDMVTIIEKCCPFKRGVRYKKVLKVKKDLYSRAAQGGPD